jgi:hypothetical protein
MLLLFSDMFYIHWQLAVRIYGINEYDDDDDDEHSQSLCVPYETWNKQRIFP